MTEPFDPGDMVYLDQEGGDEWDDSSFSCFVTDDWSPLPEFFPDKTQSDSPSASLPTHAVALSRSDPSYGMTETQADESSTEDEVAADTLDLDTHDAASDITSIIVSAEGNHARSNHTGDGIQKPTSFGKVSMVVK